MEFLLAMDGAADSNGMLGMEDLGMSLGPCFRVLLYGVRVTNKLLEDKGN